METFAFDPDASQVKTWHTTEMTAKTRPKDRDDQCDEVERRDGLGHGANLTGTDETDSVTRLRDDGSRPRRWKIEPEGWLPTRSADVLLAVVDASDRRADDVEDDAYRQLRKTYHQDLEPDEFAQDLADLLAAGHLTKTRSKRDRAEEIIRPASLVPTTRGRRFVENMKASRHDEAISWLAYQFGMLGEMLRRVDVMLRGHEQKPEPTVRNVAIFPGPDGLLYYDDPVLSTASESFVARVESYVRPDDVPVEIPSSLTEYRADFEWALLLTRKLSDVVSSKPKRYPTDVRLSDLVGGQPAYTLPALSKEIIQKIDRHVAHQTNYWTPDWSLGEIEVWWKATLEILTGELPIRNSKLAAELHAFLAQFRDEIVEYG